MAHFKLGQQAYADARTKWPGFAGRASFLTLTHSHFFLPIFSTPSVYEVPLGQFQNSAAISADAQRAVRHRPAGGGHRQRGQPAARLLHSPHHRRPDRAGGQQGHHGGHYPPAGQLLRAGHRGGGGGGRCLHAADAAHDRGGLAPDRVRNPARYFCPPANAGQELLRPCPHRRPDEPPDGRPGRGARNAGLRGVADREHHCKGRGKARDDVHDLPRPLQ